MFECAFIYVAPGQDPEKQNALIESDSINLHVYGCSTYDQAENVAKKLVAEGIGGIELCAGFGIDGVARIKKVAGPNVPVGVVRFDFHPAFEFKSGDDLFQG